MLSWVTRTVRGKLLAVVIVTTCAALSVAASALIVYDLHAYEQSRIDDLTTLADVLGAASGPALAFQDTRGAAENLALLRVRPTILGGALYDASGRLFAAYAPEQLGQVSIPFTDMPRITIIDRRLSLAQPVFERGERVGTLYLVAKHEAVQRLLYSAAIVAVVVLFSLLVALLVSTWLGRTLSTPIRSVASAARRVLEHRDYSVRVEKTTQDEIGYLVDTFNAMLDEVGRRSAALEDADRRKDQFLAVLSHELRNPLSPILNAVAVLRLDKARAIDIEWAGQVIERQARQLARLLDDLMDVARITRNKVELRMERVDVRTVVDMATEATRAQFEANEQELLVQLPADPVYLRADPARIAQVVGNLLNNAAKYTGRGGVIRIRVERQGEQVCVSVKDSGIGIAAEHLPRLFEMFTQLPGTPGRSGSGLGIGLALVRAFVEMHNGTVQALSPGLGMGSEFIVTLPAAAETAEVSTRTSVATASASTPRLRILIADDVADSARTLAMGMEMFGHEVRTAPGGAEALALALEFKPDLAILDIGMPGMDGYEVARRIRASPGGASIVLLALTGLGQREDVERALSAGFDRHMTKPADFAALQEVIGAVVRQRGEASR